MSEPSSLLPEDAPRAAVIRSLQSWLARRQPISEFSMGGRLESTLIAAAAEGGPGSWDRLCEIVHANGLFLDMLATAPGLWSHCRLAAGPAWNGISTMTRGLIRHLATDLGRRADLGGRWDAQGVGCVAIDGERLWLADHLLYPCQDDLETGLDCRFYGCARDPHLNGIAEQRHQWSYAQKRWFSALAGLGPGELPEAGWISSPRWLFPLPAHALPRRALSSALGQRLLSAALTAADGCATSVSSRPRPWWSDHRLELDPEQAGRWAIQLAQREQRSGFGVLAPEDLAERSSDDPCMLPMILAALAPGAGHAADRVWALVDGLDRALRRRLAPQEAGHPAAPVRIDLALPGGGHRLVAEQEGAWRSANGWAISRALGLAGLMPRFHHLQGLSDWPPSTLLRSGLAAVLATHAAAVLRPGSGGKEHGTIRDVGKLSWSWTAPGIPFAPPGWTSIEGDQPGSSWSPVQAGPSSRAGWPTIPSRVRDFAAGCHEMTVFTHYRTPPADEVPPPHGILGARGREVDEAIEHDRGGRHAIGKF